MGRKPDSRITRKGVKYCAVCPQCKVVREFTTRKNASSMLRRKLCRLCTREYLNKEMKAEHKKLGIYLNAERKWCRLCPICKKELVYAFKKHARHSAKGKWLCKGCANFKSKIRPRFKKGFYTVDLNRFKRGAVSRGLTWRITINTIIKLWEDQSGQCAFTGKDLVKYPRTWSIDRKDNKKGYTPTNVHLVHKKINVMRGPLHLDEFILLCKAVAKKK